MADGAQRFRARLEKDRQSLGWTVAALPFDPRVVWTETVRHRVCGEVRGPAGTAAFRTSLFFEPGGGAVLLVTRKVQAGAGVGLHDVVEIVLRPDLEERIAELPEELDALLDEAEGLRGWYEGLTAYMRREIGKWICGVKSDEARLRRAQQMAERMLSTMEAEVEFPPLLQRAFQTRPKARKGWERMSAAQRRSGLFAVFYYQTPEAREKRARKLVEAAEMKAGV